MFFDMGFMISRCDSYLVWMTTRKGQIRSCVDLALLAHDRVGCGWLAL